MRIGSRLGGAAAWAAIALVVAGTGAATGPQERVQPVPLGGSLTGQEGDRFFGVYVPTRYGGNLTINATDGEVGRIVGPDGRAVDQRHRRRARSAGLVHLPDRGGRRPLQRLDQVRPGRRGGPQALELLLLADQGRRDPRALVRRQRPGRHPVRQRRRHPGRHPGRLHRPGPGHRPAGRQRPARDDAGTRRHLHLVPQPLRRPDLAGARGQLYQTPVAAAEVRPALQLGGPELGGGQRPEPGHQPLAGPLPRRRRRVDPAERADPGPGLGLHRRRAEGALGRAGREPPEPPDRRLRHRHPRRPAPPRLRRDRPVRAERPPDVRAAHPRQAAGAALEHAGLPAQRHRRRGLEPGDRQATRPATTPIPGKGERSVRIVIEVEANTGSNLNNSDPKPRKAIYEYTLVYGLERRGRRDQGVSERLDRRPGRRHVRAAERAGGRPRAAGRGTTPTSPRPTSGPSTWPTAAASAPAGSPASRPSSSRSPATRPAAPRSSTASATASAPTASGPTASPAPRRCAAASSRGSSAAEPAAPPRPVPAGTPEPERSTRPPGLR